MIIEYKYFINQFSSPQIFKNTGAEKVNSITFVNKSLTNIASVNGYPLAFGEALTFSGNENEEDTTIYNLAFDAGASPNVFVIRKINYY
jgi:hypothetical protein